MSLTDKFKYIFRNNTNKSNNYIMCDLCSTKSRSQRGMLLALRQAEDMDSICRTEGKTSKQTK